VKCQARQYSDEKVCASCGLRWDANDPDPPMCRHGKRGMTAEEAKAEVDLILNRNNENKETRQ